MKRRENLAKAIYDLGKLVFAVLALGPLVSAEAFSIPIVVVGLIITVALFTSAYLIDQGG
jgi:hypothetical protein